MDSRHLRHALLTAVAVCCASRSLAMHPSHPEGFSPEKAYEVGLVDNVDLYSGSLSLSLPIGPFTLNYGATIWTYELNFLWWEAYPNRKANAGIGWYLGLGDVYDKQHWYNDTGRILFVDERGGKHVFFDQLHSGEDDGDDAVQYTRDNTYLRLVKQSSATFDIEFPDGTTRRYTKLGGHHRFTKQWSRFASASDPDLEVTYSTDYLQWTLTDRYGRTHYVHLTDEYTWLQKVITQVDLESYQGQRKVYDFQYSEIHVDRSCKDDSPYTDTRVLLPHLKQIDLPDGTSYLMHEAGSLLYENHCSGQLDELPGLLNGIILPTGGRFEWTHRLYDFPGSDPLVGDATGVKEKIMKAADGTVLGTWTYKPNAVSPPGLDSEMRTQVVYPTGDCSKHYFNSSQGSNSWEMGLPFAYSEEDNGLYLSSEIWDSSTGETCAGTKLRSTYVKYAKDAGTETNTNRRLTETRILFHDDLDGLGSPRWAATDYDQFDGIGHYREVTTTGNFWDGSSNNEERVVFTNYNRVAGIYPDASYEPPPVTDPWVLEIYDYVETTEDDAIGEPVARVEYGFDSATGALTCERTLKSGTTRGVDDVLVAYSHDSLGRVTDVRHYGGDLQELPTTGATCGDLPSQPEYWLTHGYDALSGGRKTTQPREPDGTPTAFLTYYVDLGPSTGLTTASRDASGRVTTYSWDAQARLTSISPPGKATLTYAYVKATESEPAKVIREHVDGAAVVSQQEFHLDSFGRRWKERLKMPGGAWSERETLYNARGWLASTSALGDLTEKTEYLGYDPFGRATIIRPPEGSEHDVRLTYEGIRRTTGETKIALPGGEAYVPRTQEWDRYGRLRKVIESSDDGAALATVYDYDVGNRLTRITSGPSGSAVTQERLFVYDNRGFLLAETHPELGAAGNGSATYSEHDARGKPGRRQDGVHDVGYLYDALGRTLEVRDRGNDDRPLLQNTYDTAAGNAIGELRLAEYNNWVDLPWNPAGEQWVRVSHAYSYDAASAALAETATTVRFQGESDQTFVRRYEYDALGELDGIEYPRCTHSTCSGGVANGPTVDSLFDQRKLSQVSGWTGTITYHENGSIHQVPYSNGVTDNRVLDPSHSERTLQLYTSGANENWDSGTMSYDGTGNFTAIGADAFTYDEVSRLVSGSVSGWDQEYVYDGFGNMEQITTTDPEKESTIVNFAVDEETNRLAAAGYDGAGNMTSWGATSYGYDALNRMSTLDSRWIYLYDADGERTAIIDWTGSISTRVITYTIRGTRGELLTDFTLLGADGVGNWARGRDRVWAQSRLLGSDDGGARTYYHLDHLGSPRLLTDDSATAKSAHDYLPYGQEVTSPGDDRLKFTGHERDLQTGIDYMHARYYNSDLARFLQFDPGELDLERPQSANRQAYVQGRPTVLIDPDGRVVVSVGGGVHEKGSGLKDLAQGMDCPAAGKAAYYHNTDWEDARDFILGELARDPQQPVFIYAHSLGVRKALLNLIPSLPDVTWFVALDGFQSDGFVVPGIVDFTSNFYNPNNRVLGGSKLAGDHVVNHAVDLDHGDFDSEYSDWIASVTCTIARGRQSPGTGVSGVGGSTGPGGGSNPWLSWDSVDTPAETKPYRVCFSDSVGDEWCVILFY